MNELIDISLQWIVYFTDLMAMSISSILFVNSVLHWKVRSIRKTTLLIVAMAVLFTSGMTFLYYIARRDSNDADALNTDLFIPFFFLLGWIAFLVRTEGKVWKRAIVTFVSLGIVSSINARFSFIPDYLGGRMNSHRASSVMYIVSSLLLILFVWLLSKISKKRVNRPIRLSTVVLLGTLLFVFEEVVLNLFNGVDTTSESSIIDIIWYFPKPESPEAVIFLMSLNILLYFSALIIAFILFAQRSENTYYKELLDANTNYLRAQTQYYEEIEKSDTEIRKIRHDMKNNLTVLSLLLENGDHDRMKSYLAELDASVQAADKGIRSGNSISDAILFDKKHKAEEAGCLLTIDGVFTFTGMSAIDTCAILGNLLDNAIEAVSSLPPEKRRINLSFSRTDNYFIISQSNAGPKLMISDNNIISTSKNDKKNHGFGLLNLKEAVAHYQGETKITCEPTDDDLYEFRMEIILPVG